MKTSTVRVIGDTNVLVIEREKANEIMGCYPNWDMISYNNEVLVPVASRIYGNYKAVFCDKAYSQLGLNYPADYERVVVVEDINEEIVLEEARMAWVETSIKETKSTWEEHVKYLESNGERHFIRGCEESNMSYSEAHELLSAVEAYREGKLDPSCILKDLVFGFGEEFSNQEAVKKSGESGSIYKISDELKAELELIYGEDDENEEFDVENLSLRESKAIRLNKFDGRKVYDGLIEKGLITSAYRESSKFTSLGMNVRAMLESEIA